MSTPHDAPYKKLQRECKRKSRLGRFVKPVNGFQRYTSNFLFKRIAEHFNFAFYGKNKAVVRKWILKNEERVTKFLESAYPSKHPIWKLIQD